MRGYLQREKGNFCCLIVESVKEKQLNDDDEEKKSITEKDTDSTAVVQKSSKPIIIKPKPFPCNLESQKVGSLITGVVCKDNYIALSEQIKETKYDVHIKDITIS